MNSENRPQICPLDIIFDHIGLNTVTQKKGNDILFNLHDTGVEVNTASFNAVTKKMIQAYGQLYKSTSALLKSVGSNQGMSLVRIAPAIMHISLNRTAVAMRNFNILLKIIRDHYSKAEAPPTHSLSELRPRAKKSTRAQLTQFASQHYAVIPSNWSREQVIVAIASSGFLPHGADPELFSTFTPTPILTLPQPPSAEPSAKERACRVIEKKMTEISFLLNSALQTQEEGDMRSSFRTLRDLAFV